MNAFEQVNQIVSMRSDAFDELRIVAKDAKSLSVSEREVITRAADELEMMTRLLLVTNAALIESQQMRIATNEQLVEARKISPPASRKLEVTLFRGTIPINKTASLRACAMPAEKGP